jgi:hypothetical protein
MSALVKSLKVNPRYDLQVPFVHLSYEQITTIDGESAMVPAEDIYPSPPPTAALSQFNGLRATIDLQGLVVTGTPPANLVCDQIIADPQNGAAAMAWWLSRHPQYAPFDPTIPPNAGGPTNAADPNNPITSFELILGSLTVKPTNASETLIVPVGQPFLPRELRTGAIAKWMNFQTQRLTFNAKANITHRNGNVVMEHPVTFQCLATNATTGSYSSQSITQYPEPIPTGLAQNLYNAVKTLQYDGELILQEQEVSGSLGVGDLFNLTGGNLAEWSTMNGMVQSITEDIDAGTTQIDFGPPKHLGAGELVDLLRVNRSRTIFYWPTLQINGGVGSSGAGSNSVADFTPEKNSAATPGFTQTHVVSGAVDGSGPLIVSTVPPPVSAGLLGTITTAYTAWLPNGPYGPDAAATPGSITISTLDIAADAGNGVFVRLQKLPMCLNGVSGSMYFLCSQFFPD